MPTPTNRDVKHQNMVTINKRLTKIEKFLEEVETKINYGTAGNLRYDRTPYNIDSYSRMVENKKFHINWPKSNNKPIVDYLNPESSSEKNVLLKLFRKQVKPVKPVVIKSEEKPIVKSESNPLAKSVANPLSKSTGVKRVKIQVKPAIIRNHLTQRELDMILDNISDPTYASDLERAVADRKRYLWGVNEAGNHHLTELRLLQHQSQHSALATEGYYENCPGFSTYELTFDDDSTYKCKIEENAGAFLC